MNINLKKIFNHTTTIIIVTLIISVVSSTYAYLFFTNSNAEDIKGNAANVALALNINQILPIKSNTGFMVPQKSTSGSDTSPLSSALKQGCVDGNQNIVCQVYEVKLSIPKGNAAAIIDGAISFYSDVTLTEDSKIKMPNLNWKLITSVDQEDNNKSVLGANIDNVASSEPAKFIKDIEINSSAEKKYYIIIWFNETGTSQIDAGNTFYGKIEITSSNGTGVTALF